MPRLRITFKVAESGAYLGRGYPLSHPKRWGTPRFAFVADVVTMPMLGLHKGGGYAFFLSSTGREDAKLRTLSDLFSLSNESYV